MRQPLGSATHNGESSVKLYALCSARCMQVIQRQPVRHCPATVSDFGFQILDLRELVEHPITNRKSKITDRKSKSPNTRLSDLFDYHLRGKRGPSLKQFVLCFIAACQLAGFLRATPSFSRRSLFICRQRFLLSKFSDCSYLTARK